ncbi:hypothetical protein TNCV_1090681 [Trichonephila clavipes]|uniref:Uncharacterized protein n=1 Tax=Trichonephila clavipes TaxID=2585209 RepID=A0A8X6SP45_TRICX|nr:hypothetical protein TNCV_1090681 [Trichonephila clavipes]
MTRTFWISFNLLYYFPRQFFLLQRHPIEVAGASVLRGSRDRNGNGLCQTECQSLRSKRLREETLDHISKRGCGDSRTRKPIISRSFNLKRD